MSAGPALTTSSSFLGRFREPPRSVVAEAQQGSSLQTLRIRIGGRTERRDRGLELAEFEFRQTKIQLNARQLWIQSDCFLVSRDRFRIFFLPCECHPQAGKSSGIPRVLQR